MLLTEGQPVPFNRMRRCLSATGWHAAYCHPGSQREAKVGDLDSRLSFPGNLLRVVPEADARVSRRKPSPVFAHTILHKA